jgi:hypothetical protein
MEELSKLSESRNIRKRKRKISVTKSNKPRKKPFYGRIDDIARVGQTKVRIVEHFYLNRKIIPKINVLKLARVITGDSTLDSGIIPTHTLCCHKGEFYNLLTECPKHRLTKDQILNINANLHFHLSTSKIQTIVLNDSNVRVANSVTKRGEVRFCYSHTLPENFKYMCGFIHSHLEQNLIKDLSNLVFAYLGIKEIEKELVCRL